MPIPPDRRQICTHSDALQRQAQHLCQRARRAQREAAGTWTEAQRLILMRRMPGATPLTCDLTLMILAQRGLLDGMPEPKRLARHSPTERGSTSRDRTTPDGEPTSLTPVRREADRPPQMLFVVLRVFTVN